MKPIYVWETWSNEKVFLDLEKENIHFIFLWWATGSGKSIFGFNFYKQLIENNSPDEIWFIFLDFIQVDFIDRRWPYLLHLPTYDVELALTILENLGMDPDKYGKKKVFLHIEENTLALQQEPRFVATLKAILKNNKNVCIVYSTSRFIKEDFDEIAGLVDVRLIFGTYTEAESLAYLWNADAMKLNTWEKILVLHDNQILLKALTEEEKNKAIVFYENKSE